MAFTETDAIKLLIETIRTLEEVVAAIERGEETTASLLVARADVLAAIGGLSHAAKLAERHAKAQGPVVH